MAKKDPYREFLEQDFGELFSAMELQERQQHYMRSRWLDQVLWMEGKSAKSRDRYYFWRLITIIGGVIVPILVSLNFSDQRLSERVRWFTVGLSGLVAVSAAVEEFFHYGEKWRHYRRSVESLKTQGWQFSQLTGPYDRYKTHSEGFKYFVNSIEEIIQRDVEVYATQITQSQKKEDSEGDQTEM